MRFDTSDLGTNGTEICACDNAVIVSRMTTGEPGSTVRSVPLVSGAGFAKRIFSKDLGPSYCAWHTQPSTVPHRYDPRTVSTRAWR